MWKLYEVYAGDVCLDNITWSDYVVFLLPVSNTYAVLSFSMGWSIAVFSIIKSIDVNVKMFTVKLHFSTVRVCDGLEMKVFWTLKVVPVSDRHICQDVTLVSLHYS